MAWSTPTSAVTVVLPYGTAKAPGCSPLLYLSNVCAVNMPTRWGLVDRVRLYGVDSRAAESAISYDLIGLSGCTPALGSDFPLRPLMMPGCTSGAVQLGVGADFTFAYLDASSQFLPEWLIDPGLVTSAGSILGYTCVPKARLHNDWTTLEKDYDAGTEAVREYNQAGSTYAHPDVVKLPDGRWLMVLQRTTLPYPLDLSTFPPVFGGLDRGPSEAVAGNAGSPECANAEIVAWLADDEDFTQNLRGPYWMVDATDALPVSEWPAAATTWPIRPRWFVGVPSAVVVGDNLYLYYAIDRSMNWSGRNGPNKLDEDTPAMCAGLGGDVYSDPSEYRLAFRDYENAASPDGAGLAHQVFEIADLLRWMDFIDGWGVQESDWVRAQAAGLSIVAPGSHGGRVRIWVKWGPFAIGRIETWSGNGVLVDPAVEWCAKEERFALVTPLSKCPAPAQGCGIWRARGIASGETWGFLPSAQVGKDFRIELSTSPLVADAATSADMVVEAPLGTGVGDITQYLDPTLTYAGTVGGTAYFYVIAGENVSDGGGPSHAFNQVVIRGERDDVCS